VRYPTSSITPGTLTQVLAIPPKRRPKLIVEYLTTVESAALIAAPDKNRWTGRRDHALLVLAIQTGLRISELVSLTLTSLRFGPGASITCTGKGRRARATPLTTATETVMAAYIEERHHRPGTALFCGPGGRELSRDAIEHRLVIHVATATTRCPSLRDKHVTMHTLRHTAAMSLLAQGIDVSVIALWLGHQRTQSTDAYLHADMTIKQAALDKTRPLDTRPGTYQPAPGILAWLNSL
jgi:integrase/recombinase XerD